MTLPGPDAHRPFDTSVSQTFLSFLQPALDGLGHDRVAWAALAKTGATVWNSIVLDEVQGSRHLAEVHRRTPGNEAALLVDFLIRRKHERFHEHRWLVADWRFFDDHNGKPRLQVEARSAHGSADDAERGAGE